MKRTIHDGSRSYSIAVPDPEPGEGKHAKTAIQAYKRHFRNLLYREGIKAALATIKKERDI